MSMFDILSRIVLWLFNIWSNIPEELKKNIINTIVDAFEDIFREFYRSTKKEHNNA